MANSASVLKLTWGPAAPSEALGAFKYGLRCDSLLRYLEVGIF